MSGAVNETPRSVTYGLSARMQLSETCELGMGSGAADQRKTTLKRRPDSVTVGVKQPLANFEMPVDLMQ